MTADGGLRDQGAWGYLPVENVNAAEQHAPHSYNMTCSDTDTHTHRDADTDTGTEYGCTDRNNNLLVNRL